MWSSYNHELLVRDLVEFSEVIKAFLNYKLISTIHIIVSGKKKKQSSNNTSFTYYIHVQFLQTLLMMLPAPPSPDFDWRIAWPYMDEGSIGKDFWVAPKFTSAFMSYTSQKISAYWIQPKQNANSERQGKN